MILAGDVGATKILLEAGDFRRGRWESVLARRYLVADFDNFSAVLSAFLEALRPGTDHLVGSSQGKSRASGLSPFKAPFKAAAFGVAGVVSGNRVKMTHRAWTVDGDMISRRFGIERVSIVNDLAAAAHGIDLLERKDYRSVQPGKAVPMSPSVVLGVGTGLGVAFRVPVMSQGAARNRGSPVADPVPQIQVIPSEGGHVGFSPATADQLALWQALHTLHGRVDAEDICSGKGLANIHEFLGSSGRCTAGSASRKEPAWISHAAMQDRDSCAVAAMELFAECLGNVAGDHALTLLTRGGVYLVGGVVAKIAPSFNSARFRAAFCAKGLFSSPLMSIPVKIVTNESVPVLGAARIAAQK